MLPVHKRCQESLVCLSPEESGKSKNFLLGLLGFLSSFQSPLCQSLTFLQEQLSTIAEPTASLCPPPRTPASSLCWSCPSFPTQASVTPSPSSKLTQIKTAKKVTLSSPAYSETRQVSEGHPGWAGLCRQRGWGREGSSSVRGGPFHHHEPQR